MVARKYTVIHVTTFGAIGTQKPKVIQLTNFGKQLLDILKPTPRFVTRRGGSCNELLGTWSAMRHGGMMKHDAAHELNIPPYMYMYYLPK